MSIHTRTPPPTPTRLPPTNRPAHLAERSVDPVRSDLPAWPILALLWGMPAWWLLGLLPFSGVVMAVPMVAFLIHSGRAVLVPGALPWVAFVAWMLPCSLMLDSVGRQVGFAVRFSELAAVAVALVYVTSARQSLSVRRVLSGLTFTWAFVIVGGYLGMLWPGVTLTNTVGALLPPSMLQNPYVVDLVFPAFSEVQTPYGASEPFIRPSAPYSYTNGWGAAIAILTPVVIAAASERRTAKAAVWLMVGLVAAIPPAIATTNRGLFVGLIVAVTYVLLRLVMRGKWLPFLWVGSLGVLLTIVLLLSGLMDGILARQETVDTTEGRGNLYAETFERTLLSPVLGYGAARPSFTSEISVGTQGMVWSVMFSFGFVGLLLFALFLVGGLLRTWSAPNTPALWLHAALVAACVMSLFYGLDRHMLAICLVLGVLLRERHARRSSFWVPRLRPEVVPRAA